MSLGYSYTKAEMKAVDARTGDEDSSVARAYLLRYKPLTPVRASKGGPSLAQVVASNAELHASARPVRRSAKPSSYADRSDAQELRKVACNAFVIDEWISRGMHTQAKAGKSHVLLLDRRSMQSSRSCTAFAGIPAEQIVVANDNSQVCAEMREQKKALVYQGTLRALLDELPAGGDSRFSFVFYDGMATLMGNDRVSPLLDLRLLFRKQLLHSRCMVALTVCTRTKGGLKQTLADCALLFEQMGGKYGFEHELVSVRSYAAAMVLVLFYVQHK